MAEGTLDGKVLITGASGFIGGRLRSRLVSDGVDVVYTDTWASMGQERERAVRIEQFQGFQVDAALMGRAGAGALFMHCLPAHRGEEVATEVIDGPQSVVFAEAHNRLHAQKGLLDVLLSG